MNKYVVKDLLTQKQMGTASLGSPKQVLEDFWKIRGYKLTDVVKTGYKVNSLDMTSSFGKAFLVHNIKATKPNIYLFNLYNNVTNNQEPYIDIDKIKEPAVKAYVCIPEMLVQHYQDKDILKCRYQFLLNFNDAAWEFLIKAGFRFMKLALKDYANKGTRMLEYDSSELGSHVIVDMDNRILLYAPEINTLMHYLEFLNTRIGVKNSNIIICPFLDSTFEDAIIDHWYDYPVIVKNTDNDRNNWSEASFRSYGALNPPNLSSILTRYFKDTCKDLVKLYNKMTLVNPERYAQDNFYILVFTLINIIALRRYVAILNCKSCYMTTEDAAKLAGFTKVLPVKSQVNMERYITKLFGNSIRMKEDSMLVQQFAGDYIIETITTFNHENFR